VVFTKEDTVAIKFLCENKHYGAKHFLEEFSCKAMVAEWTEQNFEENQRKVILNE